jgi:hypothetical protein
MDFSGDWISQGERQGSGQGDTGTKKPAIDHGYSVIATKAHEQIT